MNIWLNGNSVSDPTDPTILNDNDDNAVQCFDNDEYKYHQQWRAGGWKLNINFLLEYKF